MKLIEHFPQVMQQMEEVELYAEVVQFVLDKQTEALEKLETRLSVNVLDSDTIEERRARLFAIYIKCLPYTETTLRAYLNRICGINGYELIINTQECELTARVALTSKAMLQTIEKYLDDVVPMNMVITVSLMYNQWKTVKRKTWGEMMNLTWSGIREEASE